MAGECCDLFTQTRHIFLTLQDSHKKSDLSEQVAALSVSFFVETRCNGNVTLQLQSLFPLGQVRRKTSETQSCSSICWGHKDTNHRVSKSEKEVDDATFWELFRIYHTRKNKVGNLQNMVYVVIWRHLALTETSSIHFNLWLSFLTIWIPFIKIQYFVYMLCTTLTERVFFQGDLTWNPQHTTPHCFRLSFSFLKQGHLLYGLWWKA